MGRFYIQTLATSRLQLPWFWGKRCNVLTRTPSQSVWSCDALIDFHTHHRIQGLRLRVTRSEKVKPRERERDKEITREREREKRERYRQREKQIEREKPKP